MQRLPKVTSGNENRYGFLRPGLKTGVENGIFWSESESRFGDVGGTPPPKIPRSPPPPLPGRSSRKGNVLQSVVDRQLSRKTRAKFPPKKLKYVISLSWTINVSNFTTKWSQKYRLLWLPACFRNTFLSPCRPLVAPIAPGQIVFLASHQCETFPFTKCEM